MITAATLEEKLKSPVTAWTEWPAPDTLPDIDERIAEALKDDASTPAQVIKEVPVPKIAGLDLLKGGGYDVDLEKTINDMLSIIRNMESQLENVLGINSLLEKDLRESKGMVTRLKADKTHMENEIARMKEAIPSKREIQIEIDHLVEERNIAQKSIHDLKANYKKIQQDLIQYQNRIGNLEEEKRDFVTEINFLESKLHASAEKISRCENELISLRGEKIAQRDRINALEEELQETLNEKYRLQMELKETKEGMAELHAALTDSKLQAKKSFYKAAEQPAFSSNQPAASNE
ncbi:MAG: hypothetical protein HQK59_06675 [Deltaproteobacteria bacterium]|nr:hypothetical protein [Deltaproteobacteria bacterium]